MAIRINLRSMLAKVEIDSKRKISARGLARVIDVDVSTINALLNNRAVRVDLRVCERILKYFQRKGYYYTMSDLFELREEVDVLDVRHDS